MLTWNVLAMEYEERMPFPRQSLTWLIASKLMDAEAARKSRRALGVEIDSSRLLAMLDRAMQSTFDCNSPLVPWKKLVKPGEVVGLEVNCLTGRGNATRRDLVDAICERLQQFGVRDIVIWDPLER
jgi:hypothetical protein